MKLVELLAVAPPYVDIVIVDDSREYFSVEDSVLGSRLGRWTWDVDPVYMECDVTSTWFINGDYSDTYRDMFIIYIRVPELKGEER